MGFLEVLTLVFIVLKLTSYIDWSWWWVLSPLWVAFAVYLVLVTLVVIFQPSTSIRRKRW